MYIVSLNNIRVCSQWTQMVLIILQSNSVTRTQVVIIKHTHLLPKKFSTDYIHGF